MLFLPKEIHQKLIESAQRSSPKESSGLLFGSKTDNSETIEEFCELENISDYPNTFSLNQSQFYEAISNSNYTPLAFFHSHPSDLPIPSRMDVDGAGNWSHLKFLILSLISKPELRVWKIHKGEIYPEIWKLK